LLKSYVKNQSLTGIVKTYEIRVEADSSVAGLAFGASNSFQKDLPLLHMGLGTLASGESAGTVKISSYNVGSLDFSSADLIYTPTSNEVSIVEDPNTGDLWQVFVPQGLADVEIDYDSQSNPIGYT
ncbi:hypothetical protein MLD52_23390, partial [Puniceicoccaceae bacterium K14]|nr:hypothetical protein [Puniceicoccaceae bacterium K14]